MPLRNFFRRFNSCVCDDWTRSSLDCGLSLDWRIEQPEDRPNHSFKQGALGPEPGGNPDAEHNAEQQTCGIARVDRRADHSISPPTIKATPEERLDLAEIRGDQVLYFRVVRRDFECRIDNQATAMVRVGQRLLDQRAEKLANSVCRLMIALEKLDDASQTPMQDSYHFILLQSIQNVL